MNAITRDALSDLCDKIAMLAMANMITTGHETTGEICASAMVAKAAP